MRTRLEIETEFASRDALDGIRSFVLVGIAGAGMSGVARMLRRRGFAVRGTDASTSDEFYRLIGEGFDVVLGHTGEGIQPGDAIVLTDAIDLKSSPEVQSAKFKGCKLFRRSQVLGWLLKDKKTICVTGTHGKTTTTGFVGAALKGAGLDPTIVVGANVPEFGSPVVEGSGEYAVVEACEAYDSLRDFDPAHIILTNFEPDHLDFHGSWEELKGAMLNFVRRLPFGGKLVYCAEDSGASEIAAEVNDSLAYGPQDSLPEGLALPGRHNQLNARAAQVVAELVGANASLTLDALKKFRGAERRLQVLFDGDITVIDDYAHHPKEIEASIAALRQRYPDRRLVVAFQPHLYSRTRDFLSGFSESLSAADHLVLTDIYPAREDPIPGISSARIAEAATAETVDYVPSRHLLPSFMKSLVRGGDVVVGMGAGNISDFGPRFVKEWTREPGKRIAVLYGGDSAEREVSILSGRAICAALKRKGYDAYLFDASEALLSGKGFEEITGDKRPDCAFLAVHGNRAEDGAIQGLLELMHIPYTGSDIQTSAIAMDKAFTKQLLSVYGIRFPKGVLLKPGEALDFGVVPAGPWVVKPNAQGSTIGISFVEDRAQLADAVERARHYGDDILIEEWVKGTEISIPVLCGEALPAVEIVPASGTYDFAAKYTPGATEERVPARVDEAVLANAAGIALAANHLLGARGATRTDMIVRNDEVFVLEVNTLPGMTPTSLLPRSADAAGITFDDLCDRILCDALKTQAP